MSFDPNYEDYDEDEEKDEKKNKNKINPKYAEDVNLEINEMQQLRDDIAKKQPLVSDLTKLESILKEFKEHKNYTRQIETLIKKKSHNNYRQMRPDGNCFYRAFLLALFSYIEINKDEKLLSKIIKLATPTLNLLLVKGYDDYTMEDFYNAFMGELTWLQEKISSQEDMKVSDDAGTNAYERLGNDNHSQYLIFWARMITSVYIMDNENDFKPFVQGKTFHEWIKSDVEALYAEADQPQCVALSSALEVPFRLICLENVDNGGPQIIDLPNEKQKPLFDLLYRPGHYDILYRNEDNPSY